MRTTLTTLGAALCLGLLLTLPAQAQTGREPTLRRILFADGRETTTAPIGGTIYLEGRELFEPPEPPKDEDGRPIRKGFNPFADLEVKIDGQECMVLGSTLERITISVHPAVKPGKRRTIKVEIKGRGSAKIKLDIVSMDEWTKSQAGMSERESEAGGSQSEAAERSVLQSFQIQKFQMVKGGVGQTFQIEGLAKGLPDGLKVELSLLYDKREILSRTVPIKDERFTATFGPYTQKMLVGNYAVEMIFALNKQSRRRIRKWMKTVNKKKLALYKRVVRRGYTSVGGSGPKGDITPEDRARQEEELRTHVRSLCQSAEGLMDELNSAYAGAARSFFKQPGDSDYDRQKYLDWLVKSGYAADAAAAERIQRETLWSSSRGHFDDEAWARFGRDKLIPGLAELVKKNETFNAQYIAPPNGRADELGQFLISNVAKLYQKRTNDLYQQSRLTPPREIREFPFSVLSAPQVSRKYFDAKRKELLRTVGAEVD